MTPDLEKTLINRYPEIFKDAGGDPTKTCMAWGLDVGDGWYDIIDTLCGQLVGRLRHEQGRLKHFQDNEGKEIYGGVADRARINEQVEKVAQQLALVPVAAQVKEKFGTLRFYTNGHTPEQGAKISFAEAMSGRVCEECGNRGRLYSSSGWMRTLCASHADAAYGPEVAQKERASELDQA